MKKLNQQELREKIKTLPPDLTDAVFSPDFAEVLLSIGKKYGLLLDKVGELSSAVNHVILGVLHPKDFIPTLEQVLGVDRETAKKIAQEVNTEVFAKIRESLKKVHGITEEPTKPLTPTPSVSPVSPDKPIQPGIKNQESGIKEAAPAPTFSTDKKIPFSDLKTPTPPSAPRDTAPSPTPPTPSSSPTSPIPPISPAKPVSPIPTTMPVSKPQTPITPPSIRPFQGGGVGADAKKPETEPVSVDGNLEKEVEGLLKAVETVKPNEEPKKLWPKLEIRSEKSEVGDKKPVVVSETANQVKPLVDVKIRQVEEPAETPKMSPFGSKMQDGVFRPVPAPERKITEEKSFGAAEDGPPVPKYGFKDPYREAPTEAETGARPRAS